LPKRNEFEIEYVNEAEEIISGLTFSPTEETEESLKQKIQQMNDYNDHLLERKFRTSFALEWGLLDREVPDLGGETPEEREMEQHLMPLAQVLPRQQLLEFAQVLKAEMRAHADLQMLAAWKRNGIATHDEGFLFNRLKALIAQTTLTEEQVEEWNALVRTLQNSSEFRATLGRGIMSAEENELTKRLQIAPAMYLRIKDVLIREHMKRGTLTMEDVELIAQDTPAIVVPIYELLVSTGIFLSSEHRGQPSVEPEAERSKAEAEVHEALDSKS
jgi:transcriptional adapter 2-alpha